MKTVPNIFAVTLLVLRGLAIQQAANFDGAAIADPKTSTDERERLHAGERGDKPLKGGPPLSRRKLTREELARAVSGRLKDHPEEQRRAVQLYIESLVEEKQSLRSSNCRLAMTQLFAVSGCGPLTAGH